MANQEKWQLFRDGKLVHVFDNETNMWDWLHRQHSFSITHAFKHEGYTAIMPNGEPYQAPKE